MHTNQTNTKHPPPFLVAMDARTLRLAMEGAVPAMAVGAAVEAVRRRIWGFDPVAFGNATYRVCCLGADERHALLGALYALEDPPEDATRLLRSVFGFFLDHPELVDDRQRWETWFISWAGPNQAEAVAEHFAYGWHFWSKGQLDPQREVALMRWMVDNGAATLLDLHWGGAIRALLLCADFAGGAEREAVVATILRSRSLDAALQEDTDPSLWLWPALDRALSSASVAAALLSALQRSTRARSCFRARSVAYALLEEVDDVEAGRLAKFSRLRVSVESWVHAAGGPGAALLVTYADELHMLPIAPDERAAFLDALDDALQVAFADIGSLVHRRSAMDALLLLGQAWATTSVVRRHAECLDAATAQRMGRDPIAFRALLSSPEHAAVAAALSYLADATPVAGPTLSDERTRELVERFVAIARVIATTFPDLAPELGLDEVSSVRIEARCADPDVVLERQASELVVSSVPTIAGLVERFGEHRGTQVACLYFAHELIHHFQGLARKTTVTEVRKHGSESVVLRLDLEADMLAIVTVSKGSNGAWTHAELLDRTLEGLEAFPATTAHANVSTERKSLRFASLVFNKCVGRLEDGYVVLDLPPYAGSAFLIRVHRVECVEHRFSVLPDDVQWLRNVALEGAGSVELGDVEARCARLLLGAVRGGEGPVRPKRTMGKRR